MTKSQKIIEKQKKYIFDAVKNYYEEPIVVSNAKGSIVKDLDGKSYLDFFGGILTVSIGHANEEVNTAVKTQINHLTHISSLYPSVPVVDLAERLVKLAPQNLEKVFCIEPDKENMDYLKNLLSKEIEDGKVDYFQKGNINLFL